MVEERTLKVFINPYFTHEDKADGGIRRVVEAMVKHLPKFGVEVVRDASEADVINNHGAALTTHKGIPSVHTSHGLYWSRYPWDTWAHEANDNVTNSMKRAVAHTACSEWVRDAIVRGMLIDPEVVLHGVDIEDWDVDPNPAEYVFWNKARADNVSNPKDLETIAAMMPHNKFLSTIGKETDNLKTTGKMPYEEMKKYIARAGVYLATARETFGIGTLEALAAGVPVVGWDWGGQSEIIIQGETGILVPPGNYQMLAYAIQTALVERPRMSKNARQDVEDRWGWEHRIEQYANLFYEVAEKERSYEHKVSVIVTSYNLGKYLGDCLASIRSQSLNDWECIIVDDCSEDNTEEVAKAFSDTDPRFKYFKTPENSGLSMARNFGIENSSGKYIIPLDADDMFDEHALRILSDSLDDDPDIHIAYGHLDTVSEEGHEQNRNPWPPEYFSWRQQMAHLNQLPYSAMMRRHVYENVGGYRKRDWRAEDASMWCRVSSLGFVIKKVTQRSLLLYRNRSTSKTQQEIAAASSVGEAQADGDWTSWFPWRLAGSPQEASKKYKAMASRRIPDAGGVPFGAQGRPPKKMRFWHVHDYSYPKVSVVIPVGAGHEEFLIDAAESVFGQTYPDWELIVVNDTGKELDMRGMPYAKLLDTGGGKGVSFARNMGARAAKGEALFPLDADDYLMPNALNRMVAYLESNNGIIFSGWLKNDQNEPAMEYFQPKEFVCGDIVTKMYHSGSSILVPMWLHEKIGGWDEEITGWEDWDYLIAAQHHGGCSYLVPEALFVYRFNTGTRREDSYNNSGEVLEYIDEKWKDYRTGEKKMGCGCKRKVSVVTSPMSALASAGNFEAATNTLSGEDMVMLEYQGPHVGPITIRGPESAKKYRFGTMEIHKRKYVMAMDAETMLGQTYKKKDLFKLVGADNPAMSEERVSSFVGRPITSAPLSP